jgi:hypothetical protein
MPSTRSESRRLAERDGWGLALLIAVTLLMTAQALAVDLSDRLLVSLLITLALSAWALQLLAGWRGFSYLKTLLVMMLMGHLGMLLGAAMDFGAAGLLMLAGWCSTLSGVGLGNLWSKLGMAPWSHVGMLLGCNLGMLLSGCNNALAQRWHMPGWLFLSLSNLGMLLGLLLSEAWQPALSGSLQLLALVMVVQMLLAMAAGMAGAWWLTRRLCQPAAPGRLSLHAGGR